MGDMSQNNDVKLVLALPKGRILKQVLPVLARAGLEPEAAFFDSDDRRLSFVTNHDNIDIIRVRSFDVATFLAYGAAHIAIAGSDVLMEFDHPEIYAPVDLGIGACRMVVASEAHLAETETRVAGLMCGLQQNIRKSLHGILPAAGFRQNV
jgi:ATP phosphoribosyltransferase